MRGFFFGGPKRNDNYRLTDPRPLPDYGNACCTGHVGADGFAVLSRADPDRAGNPPPVGGSPTHRGPDQSFEQ